MICESKKTSLRARVKAGISVRTLLQLLIPWIRVVAIGLDRVEMDRVKAGEMSVEERFLRNQGRLNVNGWGLAFATKPSAWRDN